MHRRVRIKFCGMTRTEDITHAVGLGVDAIGLIFYPQSSRCVSVEQATILLKIKPPFINVVAVFVNPQPSLVLQVIAEVPVQYLQFHGDESPEFCEQFKLPYIKAMRATSMVEISLLAQQHKQAAAILLDTPSVISYGGTGKQFDWDVIPRNLDKPIILAGGLNASNVSGAVAACSPFAIDVCTGVEASPGIKDQVKMCQFVNALWRDDEG